MRCASMSSSSRRPTTSSEKIEEEGLADSIQQLALLHHPSSLREDRFNFDLHSRLKPVVKAHTDDIHVAEWVTENAFVTGSKDNSLNSWIVGRDNGKIIPLGPIFNVSRPETSKWITALSCKDRKLVSGSRNGEIAFWELTVVKRRATWNFVHQFSAPEHTDLQCKKKNLNRITTLCSLAGLINTEWNDQILVGRPTEILSYVERIDGDTVDLQLKWSQKVHVNDWVYCIMPLEERSTELICAVVIGSSIELYSLNPLKPKPMKSIDRIWSEPRHRKGKEESRAHIAAICRLRMTNNSLISGACFDSSIRIFDITHRSLLHELRYPDCDGGGDAGGGKMGRCWNTLEFEPYVLLSCADDGYIRVWDLRTMRQEGRSKQHPGRVSCLLKHELSNIVVSGSCADDTSKSKDKCCLFMWDIRRGGEHFVSAGAAAAELAIASHIESGKEGGGGGGDDVTASHPSAPAPTGSDI